MGNMLVFIESHRVFAALMLLLDIVLVGLAAARIHLFLNRHLLDASGGRNGKKSAYRKYLDSVMEYIEEFESRINKENLFTRIYRKSKITVRQCGMYDNIAVFMYMFLRYALPVLVFVWGLVLNFPRIVPAFTVSVIVFGLVEYSVRYIRNGLSNQFRYSAYKIYRYLHNQVSAGVNVTDAIKTAYKVVESSKLQDNLILMAARYSRTLDIDCVLEEFKSNYSMQEVESLCVALKQGVATGDNKDILERQERLMFNQYFNFVQAETEACRRKRALIIAIYALIIIILIAIPLLNDVNGAVSRIFIG